MSNLAVQCIDRTTRYPVGYGQPGDGTCGVQSNLFFKYFSEEEREALYVDVQKGIRSVMWLDRRIWDSELPRMEDDRCCRLHEPAAGEHSGGCSEWAVGSHEAIKSAGMDGYVCHADERSLRMDVQFASVMAVGRDQWSLLGLPGGGKYMKGATAAVSVFGKGYCYLHAVEPGARFRAARTLGPDPFLGLAVRVWECLGIKAGPKLLLEEVGDGRVHVKQVRPVRHVQKPFVELRHEALRIMKKRGEGLKVGRGAFDGLPEVLMESSGVRQFIELLRKNGVAVPDDVGPYLGLTLFSSGVMPSDIVGGRDALRMYAWLGDRYLKLELAKHCVEEGLCVEDAQGIEVSGQTNAALTAAMTSKGLTWSVRLPPGVARDNVKVMGMAAEAMIGVLYRHAQDCVVNQFCGLLGIIPFG